jgi:hypothetical protein
MAAWIVPEADRDVFPAEVREFNAISPVVDLIVKLPVIDNALSVT